MFDIGFSELLLVFFVGLLVFGPQRLPGVVKSLVHWVRLLREMAASVQQDLVNELKLDKEYVEKNTEHPPGAAQAKKLRKDVILSSDKTVDELKKEIVQTASSHCNVAQEHAHRKDTPLSIEENILTHPRPLQGHPRKPPTSEYDC